jgi:hypothetical protein
MILTSIHKFVSICVPSHCGLLIETIMQYGFYMSQHASVCLSMYMTQRVHVIRKGIAIGQKNPNALTASSGMLLRACSATRQLLVSDSPYRPPLPAPHLSAVCMYQRHPPRNLKGSAIESDFFGKFDVVVHQQSRHVVHQPGSSINCADDHVR